MYFARRLAELLSRGRALKRRLPKELGGAPIFVSPDAALRFWRRDLFRTDPPLFHAARELVRPGDVIWDIGTNVGLFAFAAAAQAGPNGYVLAVEPDLWLVQLLQRSRAIQPASSAPMKVLPAAISDSVDVAEFCIAARGRSSNCLAGMGGSQTGGTREREHVVTVTLDWLAERFPPPSVLKVDVEGAEALVLRGSRRVLAQSRPRILIEVYEQNSAEVGRVLRELGYRLFDADQPAELRRPLEVPAYNTLAVCNAW